MKIEPNKTYLTRTGSRVTILAVTGERGTYAFVGEDEQGRPTWRSARGRFTRHPHCEDLVAEAR